MSSILTIQCLFLLGSIVTAIYGAMNKCPWYVPVFLLQVVVAVGILPIK